MPLLNARRPKKDALQILKNVRAAMGDKKATLVVGECALPDHGVVGVPPVMYGIDIQVTFSPKGPPRALLARIHALAMPAPLDPSFSYSSPSDARGVWGGPGANPGAVEGDLC